MMRSAGPRSAMHRVLHEYTKPFCNAKRNNTTICTSTMPKEHPITLVQHQGDTRLVTATLHRRYKRFLADCEVDGEMQVVFCPNTGPMTGLLDHLPCPAKLSVSDNPSRKYRYTVEWLQPNPNRPTWVGVHSARANHYVRTMLDMGILSPLLLGPTPLARIQSEVRYGTSSRVDFVLHAEDDTSTYVEVKSVTMVRHEEEDDGVRDGEQDGNKEEEGNTAVEESDMQSQYKVTALFPDTVSTRAQQHAKELTLLLTNTNNTSTPPAINTSAAATSSGSKPAKKKQKRTTAEALLPPVAQRRAVMLFVVQRDDADCVAPCREKDPLYATLCAQALAVGVQLVGVAIRLDAERDAVEFVGVLPVVQSPS